MIRRLSFILALVTVLLSTAPCFLMDECLFHSASTVCDGCEDEDDCDCTCCSPFLHCNTCTGCTIVKPVCFSRLVAQQRCKTEFINYKEDVVASASTPLPKPPKHFVF